MDTESIVIRVDGLKPASNVPLDRYNHNIQFYTTEIPGEVRFEDFLKLGVVRLTIHRIVREIKEEDPRKCCQNLAARLRERGLGSFADLFDGSNCDDDNEELRLVRWRDHVSHNAACLGLSQKPETRLWLMEMEHRLLRWRLSALSNMAIESLMRINNIQYPTIDQDEKNRLNDKLRVMIEGESGNIEETVFYKVPYLDALDAIGQRTTFLESGSVYLTMPLMRSVIYHRFRRRWKMQIKSFGTIYRIGDEPKLPELVTAIEKVYNLIRLPYGKPQLTRVKDLDSLSKTSYPPCMRKLHEALRANHHLRNQGRVQYTLFLKTIGVEAEAAVEFFRNEMTRKMTDEAFEKEYAYYIRHLYGLVGSKKEYSLFDCNTLAARSAGANEYHGCPFAGGDIEDLGKMLVRWKIPTESIGHISELSKGRKYGDACSMYFTASQGSSHGSPIINPMDFYQQSKQIHNPEGCIRQNEDKTISGNAVIDIDDVEEDSDDAEEDVDAFME